MRSSRTEGTIEDRRAAGQGNRLPPQDWEPVSVLDRYKLYQRVLHAVGWALALESGPESGMSLETYITLQEASQRYNLNDQLLTRLVTDGRIRGGRLNGTFVLSEMDTQLVAEQQATKEELRARVAHLEGKPIGVNEAAQKYGLRQPNISTWIKAGYIRVLSPEQGRGYKKLVDESDVAYAKELSKLHPISQGKRVFTPAFVPDWF